MGNGDHKHSHFVGLLRGSLRYIVVHMRDQKGKVGLLQPKIHKAGNAFRVLKCQFSGKRG